MTGVYSQCTPPIGCFLATIFHFKVSAVNKAYLHNFKQEKPQLTQHCDTVSRSCVTTVLILLILSQMNIAIHTVKTELFEAFQDARLYHCFIHLTGFMYMYW